MTRYAIIMSAEKYQHFTPTQFTHADSDLLFDTLTKKCDYAVQHTILFKLSPDATKSPSDILSEIRNVVSNSTSGDSILFYFAGHGHFYEGKTYLILPNTVPDQYETTALPLDDISKELRLPERACFRLFDACHSGIDVRDGEDRLNSNGFIRSISHDASGWVTIAACNEDQYSISDPKIGHGLFTHYLCEEISNCKNAEVIYPETLKVKIADRVLEHSKTLGYTQTPTMNASISGNISIATKGANVVVAQVEKAVDTDPKSLGLRIAKLKEVKDILTNEVLENVLSVLSEQCLSDFTSQNILNFAISLGAKMSANEIPEKMHPFIVKFAKKISIQPRHDLERFEEEYEDPYSMGAIYALYPKKMKTRVSYSVRQSANLPSSALIIDLKGDGRCIPNIKILVYIIPLQITVCMLVSVFNCGWRDDLREIELVKNYYQMLQPADSNERIRELGPVASKDSIEIITNIVQKRVDHLERELLL